MIKPTDFHRMWIAVPDELRTLLNTGNVLTCSHEQVQFAMAVDTETDAAAQVRDQLAADRPAYMILPTQAVLAAIAAGETIEVTVWAGQDATAGAIRLTGDRGGVDLRTEHGDRAVTSTVLSQLHTGDFFAICERNEYREWVVYRALADAIDGRVEAQRTSAHDEPVVSFTGLNQVVYLLPDRAEMLDHLGWGDLTAANA
ncbi:hypothetical protein [Catenuloplanes japonicus]|uniref:hypothetical protein n=1 Tax=Catenuloplanes japonicus TaxID=33876 RepID=UPI000526666E|nr:hypothetical protein [Catenuloplanes japonicus]